LMIGLPLLDLCECDCRPKPQHRKEDVDQATYRYCAFLPVPRAQTNGRRFTSAYLKACPVERAHRDKTRTTRRCRTRMAAAH
jgi:hypothetical protein